MVLKIKKNKLILNIKMVTFLFFAIALFMYNYEFYFSDDIGYIVADSKYYVELAEMSHGIEGLIGFTLINKNLFGPLLYFDIFLQENRYLFFIITFLFFYNAIINLYKNIANERNKKLILFFIIFNPVVIASFSGPNKEIVGYISILYLINFILNKKIKYIFLAIIFSVFARWELLLVIGGFLTIRKIRYKKMFLILLVFSISLVIFYYDPSYEHMKQKFEVRDSSLGLVSFLAELNQKGLYILTMIPKFLINLFGDVIALNPFMLKGGYGLLIYFSQVITFFLFFKLIRRKIFNLNNEYFIFLLIFSFVFVIPSFVQHRYFVSLFPVIVLLALAPKDILLKDNCKVKKLGKESKLKKENNT